MTESLLFRSNMRILSIETSCDETAIALIDVSGNPRKPDIEILGNTLLSQAKLHEEFGGVYPNLAKREHQKNLPILLAETLRQGDEDADSPMIDFIAVTQGPGLEPALWTGIVFAQELAQKWGKPVIPVNHMEGHIFSILQGIDKPLELPALALLVSGGHTELVLIPELGAYQIIGRTQDDAVGEAFDKVARMLGLSYPGGPKISQLAATARARKAEPTYEFPRPMLRSGDLNFSYSGLKTAVLYKLKAENRADAEFKAEIARGFEDAAIEVLVEKTRTALRAHSGIRTLIVAGGVSANSYLQQKISELKDDFNDLEILLPLKDLSTDNAVMIGLAAFIEASLRPERLSLGSAGALEADGNLSLS